MYKTDRYSGNIHSSLEGDVFWIKRDTIKDYELTFDFEDMLQLFENDDISEFYYYLDNAELHKKLI